MPGPETPPALADEPREDLTAAIEGETLQKKTTHEVDTDDMFSPSAL